MQGSTKAGRVAFHVHSRKLRAQKCNPLWERTRRTLAENRRAPVRRDEKRTEGRRYLLSGLIRCGVCANPCTAHSVTNGGKRWQYYACNDNRSAERPPKGPNGRARYLPTRWLEEVVWADIRSFLTNPGEVLHRVRKERASTDDTEELEARHADLTKRLAAMHKDRDRYIRLCAQGYITESELDGYLADLRTQTDNLRFLLESVESDLVQRQ
jgi:site-specific DNA recombinase